MTEERWIATTARHGPPPIAWPDPGPAPAAAPPPDPGSPPAPGAVVLAHERAGKQTLTVEEVAAVLGWGRSRTYAALRRGDIPARRIGARGYLITVPEFARWLAGGPGA